ncbi:hypothetical protein [Phytomonospora endophytica]|uniref:Uncharacterized protein n=1 Tax=Phytomonospora endophytica TaxID=714109 RepID=A0A841FLI8_9ACTN|nr:hypothetical protein [Phytomonospora endophytica]MBB6036724.1 hypothetical protein [Phytomonospora endophytica]GIG68242.1 hypothetical protein Pen01_45370 [Phytomonospora endophytica]
MRAKIRITAATLLMGAAALAVTGLSAPAQAHDASETGGQVQAAPGWHHISDHTTLAACRKKGEEYLAKDWALRYECRSLGGGRYALWVYTNP